MNINKPHIGLYITPKDVSRIRNCTVRYAEKVLAEIARANKIFKLDKKTGMPILRNSKPQFSYRLVTLKIYCDYVGVTEDEVIEAFNRSFDTK